MNENINMRIIRYFASEYSNARGFIYQDFANEIKKLNLQDFVFSDNNNQQEIINRIKSFNQEVLEQFCKQTQNNNLKNFSKEVLAKIFTLILEEN